MKQLEPRQGVEEMPLGSWRRECVGMGKKDEN